MSTSGGMKAPTGTLYDMGYGLGTGEALAPMAPDLALGRDLHADYEGRMQSLAAITANATANNSSDDNIWLIFALAAAIVVATALFVTRRR